jgi:hypothetical protein
MRKSLVCFAHGHPGQWEAICVDFDLAVAGESFAEVQDSLSRAIEEYVALALQENAHNREILLSRRAPWYVRINYITRFFFGLLGSKRSGSETHAGFSAPCPA